MIIWATHYLPCLDAGLAAPAVTSVTLAAALVIKLGCSHNLVIDQATLNMSRGRRSGWKQLQALASLDSSLALPYSKTEHLITKQKY